MNSGPEEKKYDWQNEIVPGLSVGGAPFYRGVSNYDISQFDVIVLCADNFQYEAHGFLFKNKMLLRCPFEDTSTPFTLEEKTAIDKVAQLIPRLVYTQHKVLVTCAAGVNRSAMVAALALLQLYPKASPEHIIDLIRKKRKLDYGEALFNKSFVKYIKEWRK